MWQAMFDVAGKCPSSLPRFPRLPFHNRCEVLQLESWANEDVKESLPRELSRVTQSVPHLKITSAKSKSRVLVTDSSFQRGTEDPIC